MVVQILVQDCVPLTRENSTKPTKKLQQTAGLCFKGPRCIHTHTAQAWESQSALGNKARTSQAFRSAALYLQVTSHTIVQSFTFTNEGQIVSAAHQPFALESFWLCHSKIYPTSSGCTTCSAVPLPFKNIQKQTPDVTRLLVSLCIGTYGVLGQLVIARRAQLTWPRAGVQKHEAKFLQQTLRMIEKGYDNLLESCVSLRAAHMEGRDQRKKQKASTPLAMLRFYKLRQVVIQRFWHHRL